MDNGGFLSPFFTYGGSQASMQPAQPTFKAQNPVSGMSQLADALINGYSGYQAQQQQWSPQNQSQPQSQPQQPQLGGWGAPQHQQPQQWQPPMNLQSAVPSGPWGLMTNLWGAPPEARPGIGFAGAGAGPSPGGLAGLPDPSSFGVY